MNQKIKNITKLIALVGLIASTPSQAKVDLNSIITAIASGTKKIKSFTDPIVYGAINEALAVAPDLYQSFVFFDECFKLEHERRKNPQKRKDLVYIKISDYWYSKKDLEIIGSSTGFFTTEKEMELYVKAVLTGLNPIITSFGLEVSRYMIVDNVLDTLVKNEEKRNRIKKAFEKTTRFFGTRLLVSFLIHELLINQFAPDLAQRICHYEHR